MTKLTALAGAACLAVFMAGVSSAQAPLTPAPSGGDSAAGQSAPANQAQPAPAADDAATAAQEEPAPVDPDNMADSLNSQQQLKQTFTLKRTINGKVTDTERRTIIYDKNAPSRPTEAGGSPVKSLLDDFAREVLTRTQAFEEAKIDFARADINRDGALDESEFVPLVMSWSDNKKREAPASDAEAARQREFDAFVDQLAPDEAKAESEQAARRKFQALTNGAALLPRKDYIASYLAEFDAVDANGDGMLRGAELMRFRALNKGEPIASNETAEASQ